METKFSHHDVACNILRVCYSQFINKQNSIILGVSWNRDLYQPLQMPGLFHRDVLFPRIDVYVGKVIREAI